MLKWIKNWKLWLIGVIIILLLGFLYIQWSTAYISHEALQKAVYRSLPKEEQEALGVGAWRYFKVEQVNVNDVPPISNWSYSQRFHEQLLFLNGNIVYKVTYPLANPIVDHYHRIVYVNPFTRRIVGYAALL